LMQRFARVVGGIVAELIEIPADGPPIEDLYHPDLVATCIEVPEDSDVAEGWSWDGTAFAAPPPEVPVVPATITRRQLLLALTAAGLITGEEALAAATTGAVPAQIDAVFADLPEAEALAARITWATMSVAERAHPLILAMINAGLATPAEVDALFVAGAAL
jgi:hypothetical protein